MKKTLFIIPLMIGALLTSCAEKIDEQTAQARAAEIAKKHADDEVENNYFRFKSVSKMSGEGFKLENVTTIEASVLDRFVHYVSEAKSDSGNSKTEFYFWKDGEVYHSKYSVSGSGENEEGEVLDYSSFGEAEIELTNEYVEEFANLIDTTVAVMPEFLGQFTNFTSMLSSYIPSEIKLSSNDEPIISFASDGEGSLILKGKFNTDLKLAAAATIPGLDVGASVDYSLKSSAYLAVENYLPVRSEMSVILRDNNAKKDIVNVSDVTTVKYGEFSIRAPKA